MSELLVDSSVEESDEHTVTDAAVVVSPFEENEAALEAAVSEAERRARAVWTEWLRFAHDEIEAKLDTLLKGAVDAHRAHLSQFDKDPESDPSAAAVLEYRRAVERDVVKVLEDGLRARNIGRAIDARFAATIDDLSAVAEELPESIRLSQPDELFDPDEGDGPIMSIRKLGRRKRLEMAAAGIGMRNRFRSMVGRDEVRPVPRSRIVPARQLAMQNVAGSLTVDLEVERAALQNRVARQIAEVERALTDWANKILTEERDAEVLFESTVRPRWESVEHIETKSIEEGTETSPTRSAEPASADAGDGRLEEVTSDNAEALNFFERIEAIGKEVHQRLQSVADASEEASDKEDPFDLAFGQLRGDIQKAGTFLYRADNRSSIRRGKEDAKASGAWSDWHEQAADRLRYLDSLLMIRDRMLKAESSIVERTSRATVMQVINTFVGMKEQFAACNERAAAGAQRAGPPKPDDYAANLTSIKDDLSNFLRSIFRDLPGLVSSDQALAEPGRDEWQGLGKFVDGLPERLVIHELYDEDEPITPTPRTAELNFRGLVNDVLLIRLPDRLRKPAEGLRAAVRRVWTETEQIEHIVQYNLDAAIDELQQSEVEAEEPVDVTAEEADEKPPLTSSQRVEQAHQLTVDGLTRASNTLDKLATSLRLPWSEFIDAIDRELREDWVAIHRRLKAADSADEQWAGFRARTTRQFEKVFGRIRVIAGDVGQRSVKLFTAGRRRAESLIKIGQSAVGVVDSGDIARFETIDALSSVKGLRDGLPLIYRRLFSFEPLDEPTLLEGRARDLVWLKRHFDRWHDAKQMGVMLIQSPLGSGRTSFLNAVETVVLKGYDVRQINLPERLYHPDEFAAVVAKALNIDEAGITLDELEDRLLRTRRSDPPHVCLIDNLEHLLIRAPQSVNLMERVILFLSHTDSSIYWAGTIGAYTWQFLSKTAATAVSFVDSYSLTPLDRATMESLVINRHRRSGMPLHFPEPKDPSAIMRQRLRRAKTPEQRQALLQEDFFDRLWKASGQNVMLALYYWIRAADFSSEDGVLNVQPLRPLNFDYLSRFDLDHAFSLKAFFLHKTLSLDDHRRIFHMGKEASTAILESLLNWRLIEPVPHSERVQTDYHVQREAIYRLNPLLIHPVTVFLQSKNIVY